MITALGSGYIVDERKETFRKVCGMLYGKLDENIVFRRLVIDGDGIYFRLSLIEILYEIADAAIIFVNDALRLAFKRESVYFAEQKRLRLCFSFVFRFFFVVAQISLAEVCLCHGNALVDKRNFQAAVQKR